MTDEELQNFFNIVNDVINSSAQAMANGKSDHVSEMEVAALLTAANAFATYQLARDMRRARDALQAPAPAEGLN